MNGQKISLSEISEVAISEEKPIGIPIGNTQSALEAMYDEWLMAEDIIGLVQIQILRSPGDPNQDKHKEIST